LLRDLRLGDGNNLGTADGAIALDCSVRPTRQGHYVISTTDFFFPLVDSPFLQGRIGAANVLSDLYAQGVTDCDFVLMLLAAGRDMPEQERAICTREMVRGFSQACDEAGTVITGGQTVLNPWPIIGGVATSVVASKADFVPSDGAQVGNVLVLTKPLGTQVAVNVHQWRCAAAADNKNANTPDHRWWRKATTETNVLSDATAKTMMHDACGSMARLNQNAARLMIKHKATAATDVTGFGILGHAQNLSENQSAAVGLRLDVLPCLRHALAVNDQVLDFQLRAGYSAETSGGLLVCLPSAESAADYIQELRQLDDSPAWIVGRVVESATRQSSLAENVEFLEV